MEKKKLIIFAIVIVLIVAGLMICLCELSLGQSDATIERIDRKIEMYERSR